MLRVVAIVVVDAHLFCATEPPSSQQRNSRHVRGRTFVHPHHILGHASPTPRDTTPRTTEDRKKNNESLFLSPLGGAILIVVTTHNFPAPQ